MTSEGGTTHHSRRWPTSSTDFLLVFLQAFLKMVMVICQYFYLQEQTNKMLPEKFFSNFESFRTHQKTDKTGPETHQRTVVPERDKRWRVSAGCLRPTSNSRGHITAANGWSDKDVPGLFCALSAEAIQGEGINVKWQLRTLLMLNPLNIIKPFFFFFFFCFHCN